MSRGCLPTQFLFVFAVMSQLKEVSKSIDTIFGNDNIPLYPKGPFSRISEETLKSIAEYNGETFAFLLNESEQKSQDVR
jgi:hypothetical protein